MYLELPRGFATQLAILEKPSAKYLPTSNWLLLGDEAVRPFWLSCAMPEPPLSDWVSTSETSKKMETILPWLERWADGGIYRGHTLVVVGGGVLTDMGGLAASLYMRGISWHVWPTTLLAQIDAGLGGKTAVNLASGKNLIGAFHHPQRAVVVSGFLDSLPERHRKSGRWELVKMALLEGDLAWAQALMDCPGPSMDDMERALKLKVEIVHRDYKETGARRFLNLGHTLGHAIERASGFRLLHGEAVGLGTLAACALSENLGMATFPLGFIERLAYQLAPLSKRIPPWESCLPYVLRDKKNESSQQLRFLAPIPGSRPAEVWLSPESMGGVHATLLSMLDLR